MPDPDLEIRVGAGGGGVGAVSSRYLDKGGGEARSPKIFFGLKIRGRPPGPLPWIHH